jgi:hypothetical protein
MEKGTEEMLLTLSRRIRHEPVAQQWLRDHPETKKVLVLAVVEIDEE